MWSRKFWTRFYASLSYAKPVIRPIEVSNQQKQQQQQQNDATATQTTATRSGQDDKVLHLILNDQYKLYRLEQGPSLNLYLKRSEAQIYYRQMQTIRLLENLVTDLYRERIIRGHCHLYAGQEAVCVGIKAALRAQDKIITSYRCLGWAYVMGIEPKDILMELVGSNDGIMNGKGGSMHIYTKSFYGGNGIVGSQIPIGAGIALATKYQSNNDAVIFALYGDGAANQGQIYETYNMASLWKLPIIFCCENNHFGMSTSIIRASGNTEFFKRGHFMPGIWVDGMNILAVRNAAKFAIDYVLKFGPLILEFDTYRYCGHSMSDPGVGYRKRDEVQEVQRQRDPIENLAYTCVEYDLLTDEKCMRIQKEIRMDMQSIKMSIKDNIKEPQLEELTTDVYKNCLEKKIRGVSGYNLNHKRLNKTFNE